jgi:hypothetical protein
MPELNFQRPSPVGWPFPVTNRRFVIQIAQRLSCHSKNFRAFCDTQPQGIQTVMLNQFTWMGWMGWIVHTHFSSFLNESERKPTIDTYQKDIIQSILLIPSKKTPTHTKPAIKPGAC